MSAVTLVTALVAGIAALGAAGDTRGQSEITTRQITKLSPRASVVLDRNCPDVVQPFTLTDNAATLGLFSAKEAASDVGARILQDPAGFLTGKRKLTAPSTDKLGASAKLAAKQLNWLPMTAEVGYGERQHQQETDTLDRDSRLGRQHYPVADRMLQAILASVGQPHDYQFQLFILKNSTRNAVARPGGFLYVDQGLIDDPAHWPKAYFAVAHEVEHVLQRHETKELQSNVIDAVSSKDDLLRVMTGSRGDPNLILNYVKVEKGRFTQHHVDQELQADSCAVRLLSRALPDQQALAASINAFIADLPPPQEQNTAASATDEAKLARSVHDVVDTPVKRHPTNRERVQNLQSIKAEIGSPDKAR